MVWIWGRSGDDLEVQKQYCGVTVPATWGLRSRGSEAAAVGFWGCNGCSTGCGCTVLPGGCVDAHSPAFSPPPAPLPHAEPPLLHYQRAVPDQWGHVTLAAAGGPVAACLLQASSPGALALFHKLQPRRHELLTVSTRRAPGGGLLPTGGSSLLHELRGGRFNRVEGEVFVFCFWMGGLGGKLGLVGGKNGGGCAARCCAHPVPTPQCC